MNNKLLLSKIKKRQEDLKMSFENISNLLNLYIKDINNLFNEKEFDTKTVLKISKLLGLDTFGNSLIDIPTLKNKKTGLNKTFRCLKT